MGFNITKIIRTAIPMLKGSKGGFTIGAKQLETIAKESYTREAQIAKGILKTTKNPTLEVAYKAKSNYTIAGLSLKDGKEVVAKGAISITNPGSNNAVVKYKLNTTKSKANGFVDGGKVADTKDMEMAFSRKGGNVKTDVKVADATAHHLDLNEEEMVQYAKDFDGDNLLVSYAKGKNELQKSVDMAMTEIRRFFRGEEKTFPKPQEYVKVLSENSLEKLKAKKVFNYRHN
jgi:hypothetical protein